MIAIIDYGVGNLFSLQSSFACIGEQAIVTSSADEIDRADRIILPGVGAFADAAQKLRSSGMDRVVIEQAALNKPVLGICLGMQLLFDKSYEYGEHNGLSLIPGNIVPMQGAADMGLKIPHIGWNSLQLRPSPLFRHISEGDFVYFVHSYYATDCDANTIATAQYGIPVTAAVCRGNVYGTQFHPEKSGSVGLNILRAFCEL